MKKIITLSLALVFIFSMLTACGGNDTGTDTDTGTVSDDSAQSSESADNSANLGTRIILASELLSLEDAERIFEADLEVYKDSFDKPEAMGGIRTVYDNEDGIMVQIVIRQNAAFDMSKDSEKNYVESGGIGGVYIKSMLKYYEGFDNAIWVEGLGDWACISSDTLRSIAIAAGDYFIEITVSVTADLFGSPEEDIEWRNEKLKEAGTLALEHLYGVIG